MSQYIYIIVDRQIDDGKLYNFKFLKNEFNFLKKINNNYWFSQCGN